MANTVKDTTNIQEGFLEGLKNNKAPVTVFLVNGIKLQGLISWFDSETLLLKRDGHVQLVYKHAVSTIMPSSTVEFEPKE